MTVLVPAPLTFTMPVCPSANQLFKNTKKGRVRTRLYNDWRAYAERYIRDQNLDKMYGFFGAIFNIEISVDDTQSDLDNRLKAMIDVLKKADVIEDDRFLTFLAPAKMPAANGLAWVQLVPSDQEVRLIFRPSHDGARGGFFLDAPQQGVDNGYQSV